VRLLLIMFCSILAAQAVSGLVYLHDRREMGSRYSAFDWSERIGNIAELLSQLDPAQRAAALSRLREGTSQDVSRHRPYHGATSNSSTCFGNVWRRCCTRTMPSRLDQHSWIGRPTLSSAASMICPL